MPPRESMESPLDSTLTRENEFEIGGLPPAPRDVSPLAALTLFLKSTPTSGFGLFFLAASMVFVLILCGFGRTGAALYEALGTWEPYATGKIESCEYSGFTFNDSQALTIRYSGQSPDDGSSFRGVSHSFKSRTPGEVVVIERRKGSKDVLRVEGASIGGFGGLKEQLFLVAFLSIFLLVGAIMGVFLPIRDGARMLKILKNGEAAYGSYDKTEATGARVNGIPVCDVRFNFVTNAMEEGVATARTLDPEKLLEQPNFPILYLPENPQKTVLLNSLPDGVKLKPSEGFQASFWKILPRLILAAVVVAEIAATCVLSTRIERATFFISSAAPTETVESAESAADAEVRP